MGTSIKMPDARAKNLPSQKFVQGFHRASHIIITSNKLMDMTV